MTEAKDAEVPAAGSRFPERLSKPDLAVIQETHPEWVIRKLAQEARLLRDANERLIDALELMVQANEEDVAFGLRAFAAADAALRAAGRLTSAASAPQAPPESVSPTALPASTEPPSVAAGAREGDPK